MLYLLRILTLKRSGKWPLAFRWLLTRPQPRFWRNTFKRSAAVSARNITQYFTPPGYNPACQMLNG
jgi:hypothetical protein